MRSVPMRAYPLLLLITALLVALAPLSPHTAAPLTHAWRGRGHIPPSCTPPHRRRTPLDAARAHAQGGAPDAHISIPTMGIVQAPVWSRGLRATGDGALDYPLVPQWGLTRFRGSAPFGQPGMTLVYGHDDAYGSIFRFLSALQTPVHSDPIPFPGSEVQVFAQGHLFRYHVHKMVTTSPTDLTWLQKPWKRPTLILASCYPYKVDTQRVLAIAQL